MQGMLVISLPMDRGTAYEVPQAFRDGIVGEYFSMFIGLYQHYYTLLLCNIRFFNVKKQQLIFSFVCSLFFALLSLFGAINDSFMVSMVLIIIWLGLTGLQIGNTYVSISYFLSVTLTLLFSMFKIKNVIDWSWEWALIPIWIPVVPFIPIIYKRLTLPRYMYYTFGVMFLHRATC